jgi:nucleoside-diphosphate-sugar epimerase
VWVEDVSEAIVRCVERDETIGQCFECAGPKVFTLGELVKLAGRACGHERPLIPLPARLGKLQAMAMELMPGEPLMSRDNYRPCACLMRHGSAAACRHWASSPRRWRPLRLRTWRRAPASRD